MYGFELRIWRESRQWSRETLGVKLGYTASSIYRWERGDQDIPRIVILACEALEARARHNDTNEGWTVWQGDRLARLGCVLVGKGYRDNELYQFISNYRCIILPGQTMVILPKEAAPDIPRP